MNRKLHRKAALLRETREECPANPKSFRARVSAALRWGVVGMPVSCSTLRCRSMRECREMRVGDTPVDTRLARMGRESLVSAKYGNALFFFFFSNDIDTDIANCEKKNENPIFNDIICSLKWNYRLQHLRKVILLLILICFYFVS